MNKTDQQKNNTYIDYWTKPVSLLKKLINLLRLQRL